MNWFHINTIEKLIRLSIKVKTQTMSRICWVLYKMSTPINVLPRLFLHLAQFNINVNKWGNSGFTFH